MELAALQGWGDTTLADIAEKAGLDAAALGLRFASKRALIAAFARHIDERMAAAGERGEGGDSARDRLFDTIMRRFDALAPYRKGVEAVLRHLARHPRGLACACAGPFRQSLAAIAKAATLPDWGLLQPLRMQGLAAVYLMALRTFLADDSADLAKTMAQLDRLLARVESLLRMLPGSGARRAEAG